MGIQISVKFPSVKLLDYAKQWDKLKASKNRFAIVVMAHLKTKETKGNYKSRKIWKMTLLKMLYEKGYKKQDIINLFGFIDWLMRLPKELEKSFIEEISQHEEDKKMPYITSVERFGVEKGIQQGILQGKQQGILQGIRQGKQQGKQQGMLTSIKEVIIETLEIRFEKVPFSILQKINELNDIAKLKKIHKSAVTEPSIESFRLNL